MHAPAAVQPILPRSLIAEWPSIAPPAPLHRLPAVSSRRKVHGAGFYCLNRSDRAQRFRKAVYGGTTTARAEWSFALEGQQEGLQRRFSLVEPGFRPSRRVDEAGEGNRGARRQRRAPDREQQVDSGANGERRKDLSWNRTAARERRSRTAAPSGKSWAGSCAHGCAPGGSRRPSPECRPVPGSW